MLIDSVFSFYLRHRQLALKSFLFILACIAIPADCWADKMNTRYVANHGSDEGDCKNPLKPCATLSYALSKAGKVDHVHLEQGEYFIRDEFELMECASALHRIMAGYAPNSEFKNRDKEKTPSTIYGVHPDLRDAFNDAGFHVVSDGKGIEPKTQKEMSLVAKSIVQSKQSHSQTQCAEGFAGEFPCNNVDLLAHLYLTDLQAGARSGSDIWGHTDLNTGREYVIITLSNGGAVVAIDEPTEPKVVARFSGPKSDWRDVKTYQFFDEETQRWKAYAYISTEANDGIAVLDISDLSNGIKRVPYSSSSVSSAHNVLVAGVDYTYAAQSNESFKAKLVVSGANSNRGRFILFNLNDPSQPELSQAATNTGYSHDVATFSLSDERKQIYCPQAEENDACQILADFNEGSFDIWNLSTPNDATKISGTSYPNAVYVHSGWFSEDGQHLLVHDELDEKNLGLRTTIRAFDLSDLSAPKSAGVWEGPSFAVDHNGFVRGSKYYVSNYTKGLTVLDLSRVDEIQEVAKFDTVTQSDGALFVGAWGVYPFFASGVIAVSDINSGLYLLQETSQTPEAGFIGFSETDIVMTEGGSIEVGVERRGGTAGAASIEIEVNYLNTPRNDLSLSTRSLSWANGEVGRKTFTVSSNVNSNNSITRLFSLRLLKPSKGAHLDRSNISLVKVLKSGVNAEISAASNNIVLDKDARQVNIPIRLIGSIPSPVQLQYEASGARLAAPKTGSLQLSPGGPAVQDIVIELDDVNVSEGNASFEVKLRAPASQDFSFEGGAEVLTITVAHNLNPVFNGGGNPSRNNSNNSIPGFGGGNFAGLLWIMGLLVLTPGLLSSKLRRKK